MSTCSQRLAETCAENIALLHLLHTVPVPPSCNNVDTGLTCQGNYSLTINQEQTLGSTLAFLSNIIDDTKHVPALCIEENIESASLDVMLAVNKTCWGDGKEILKKLKHRFDEIFAILSKASKGMLYAIYLMNHRFDMAKHVIKIELWNALCSLQSWPCVLAVSSAV